MAAPVRPDAVPADAWWSPDDNEWVLGDKDPAGKLVGTVRYWRPDGSLVSDSEHAGGVPHGVSRRYHETGEVSQIAHYDQGKLHGTRTWFATGGKTTEKMHAGPMSRSIVRAEVDYARDVATAFRYFDKAGRAVAIDGTPLAGRPPGVPPTATGEASGDWIDGTWTEQGDRIGKLRRWNKHGVLIGEEDAQPGGVVDAIGYRPDDGSRRLQFRLRDGALDGDAVSWRRDGSVARRAQFGATWTIEDLDPAGAVVRRVAYGAEPAPAPAPSPTDADLLVLDALAAGDASALEVAGALSPAGLAHAIARGWGGHADRDAGVARAFRKLVRRIAPASVTARLAALGLDRAPRVTTATRLAEVARTVAEDPAVDASALTAALIDAGGPGASLATATPGRASAFLAARIKAKHLGLQHLGLTELPAAVGRFPDLQHIDATANQLATVPAALADVQRLQKLDLSRNKITSLPRELAWLPELYTLHLADNELAAVPDAVFALPELGALGLGDNALATLPDAIGELSELHTLWLNDNPLTDLPRAMLRCKKLTFLHLGDLELDTPPAVLGEMEQLEELWIASRSLAHLPGAICALPRLRRLHVWYSSLTSVPDELYAAKNLVELRIRDNPLPDEVFARLKEALPGCTIY